MKTIIINRLIYAIACLVVVCLLLSANKIKMPATPYELLVLELKANEGYKSWWYPDGYVDGRRAYSIGFGWNDQGRVRRSEIKKWTADGEVTYDEALEITLMEIRKYGRLHKDPYKNVALQLYSYNCGLTKSGSRLGKCCGAKWGCGNVSKNVRKSHNRRRQYELALWNKDVGLLQDFVDDNRLKVSRFIRKYKGN